MIEIVRFKFFSLNLLTLFSFSGILCNNDRPGKWHLVKRYGGAEVIIYLCRDSALHTNYRDLIFLPVLPFGVNLQGSITLVVQHLPKLLQFFGPIGENVIHIYIYGFIYGNETLTGVTVITRGSGANIIPYMSVSTRYTVLVAVPIKH